MGIAPNIQDFLAQEEITYDVVTHPRSMTSRQAAAGAHVPGARVAKAVLLEDERGYLLAVLPATHVVEVGKLGRQLHRSLRLAAEAELPRLFRDCALGAVPAVGDSYGLPTVVESDLAVQPDIYFEAGDHERLIHLSGGEFARLMAHADVRHFSHRT